MKVCLDLFCGLGGFSAAFEDASEWKVVTVDIKADFKPDLRADVMDLRPADILEILPVDEWSDISKFVVLASPPCTLFSLAGDHDQWDHNKKVPVGDRAKKHVALVHHTIGLIKAVNPDFWYLENPMGRMQWVLGEPTGSVTYCQYGMEYYKRTDIWGVHAPMEYRKCMKDDPCHRHIRTIDESVSATDAMPESHAERSLVPYEFSKAIREAVDRENQQTTLTEATA
jgi:hypothetical protein